MQTTPAIKNICESEDIAQCFDVFLELRPHIISKQQFVDQVQWQQKEGYHIAAIQEDKTIVACIGYRIMTTLAWGKTLYIDDLIATIQCRGKGYGAALLRYVIAQAHARGCDQVHLDTGFTRHAAHKVYLNHGFELHCHHLSLKLKAS